MNCQKPLFCSNYHQLVWRSCNQSICSQCGKSGYPSCRYTCPLCVKAYCVDCYKPPVDGFYCGADHKMVMRDNLINHSCDICGQAITTAYRCQQCDYDVCEQCRQFDE